MVNLPNFSEAFVSILFANNSLSKLERLAIKMARGAFFIALRIYSAKKRAEWAFGSEIPKDPLAARINVLTLLAELKNPEKSGDIFHVYSVKGSSMIFVPDLEEGEHAFIVLSFNTDEDMLIRVEIEDALPLLKRDVANAFLFNLDALLGEEDGRV